MNVQNPKPSWLERAQRFIPATVAMRVALAVDLLVVIFGMAFLIVDYYQEAEHRLADKSLALRYQALTLHQAISALDRESPEELQKFIDAVCRRMSNEEAPGHHIVIDVNGQTMHSQAHYRDSVEQSPGVRAGETGSVDNSDVLVGKHAEAGITVSIGEQMSSVWSEIRRRAILRSIGVVVFGITLTIAINLVVHKLVHKPLRRMVKTIDGIASGNYDVKPQQCDGIELARLATAVSLMSISIAQAESRRKVSLDRARKVQDNLLPRNGRISGIDSAFFHRAAEDVAGDFLDIFQTARGTTVLCVADVVGHGIAPAMIAAMLKVLVLDAANLLDNPGDMLGLVNRRFMAVNLPEDFATVFLAEWNPTSGTLSYVSAGHEPAFLWSEKVPINSLEATGPMVGIELATAWETKTIKIERGHLLTCWTDGIIDARSQADDALGRDRLMALVAECATANPQELVNWIDWSVREHLGGEVARDDCTFTAIRFE